MTSETTEIKVGDRVRHPYGRNVGVVIGLVARRRKPLARVAFEGKLPCEVPVDALVRIR